MHVVYTSMASQRVELYERSPKMTEQEFHQLARYCKVEGKRLDQAARPTRIAAGADSADAKKNLTAFGLRDGDAMMECCACQKNGK